MGVIVANQQQCPGCLDEVIQRDAFSCCPGPELCRQFAVEFKSQLAAFPDFRRCGSVYAWNRGHPLKALQVVGPVLTRDRTINRLNPSEVLGVGRRRKQRRRRVRNPGAIKFDEFARKNSEAPSINQKMMTRPNKVGAPWTEPNQRKTVKWFTGEVESAHEIGCS